MELREKGLGGWDKREVAHLGDDALGGWGGTHVPAGTKTEDLDAIRPATASGPFADKHAINTPAQEFPFPSTAAAAAPRTGSPALPRVNSPGIPRYQTPSLVSPQPQTPARSFSSHNGSFTNNAGAFNNPRPMNSRTPSFPLQGPSSSSSPRIASPPLPRFPGGNNFNGGYQRF
jgi:hypothetical protein